MLGVAAAELAAFWSGLAPVAALLLLLIEFAELAEVSLPLVFGVAAAAAPVVAAPELFIAEGPEVLLPAPQWSETMVALLTCSAFWVPEELAVELLGVAEPLGLEADGLLPPMFAAEALLAVAGCPVTSISCPTCAARLSVLPVSV